MAQGCVLIGPIVGIVIDAVTMRSGNRKLHQQQVLQFELEKNKAELKGYHEEPVSHLACSAELLGNMAYDHRQLYQHVTKDSNNPLPDSTADASPSRNHLEKSETSNDQASVQMLHDYFEGASGLLHGSAKRD